MRLRREGVQEERSNVRAREDFLGMSPMLRFYVTPKPRGRGIRPSMLPTSPPAYLLILLGIDLLGLT